MTSGLSQFSFPKSQRNLDCQLLWPGRRNPEIAYHLSRGFRSRTNAIRNTDPPVGVAGQGQTWRGRNHFPNAFNPTFVTDSVLRHRTRPSEYLYEIRLRCDPEDSLQFAPNDRGDFRIRRLQYFLITASTRKATN